ncbi:MAG: hotdog domain-containing protein [Bacteroidales bacterium]|nr:3-aminobutyryl-CoA ammonia lyase [Bacteroidales bacterium]MDD2425457.1 hotdog domain-containing protein [Bacteroidales bacterium]MDD3988557.1 hotdog domain-containing protein [Bacteroidales bacterium]MDD4638461.1 hotdog domain-containing protein [Bacteroidales bacterium]
MREKVMIRLRMSSHDAHYGGNLVDGARILQLFGDVATELLIRRDGDEGLFKAYDNIEFMAPVYAGDFIEATGEIVSEGNSSRKMVFEARKVIVPRADISPSAADFLEEPIVVCRASGTCVTPKTCQRK